MRGFRFALVLLVADLPLACGGTNIDDGQIGVPNRNGSAGGSSGQPNDPPPVVAAPACAGVAEARAIVTDADAVDLRIDDGAVFFRTGKKVVRAAKDGSGRAQVFESETLVRAFVDNGVIVTIEDPGLPGTLLRVISLDEEVAAIDVPTGWNAGGSRVFAADATSFYAVADTQDAEVIYRLPRLTPAEMVALDKTTDVISSPQLRETDVWYVREQKRIFKVAVGEAPPGGASEVFGTEKAACGLAVGKDAAFCSIGAALEQRDLAGANPRTILEASKSKVTVPFGATIWFDGTLYVRSDAPDPTMGYVIRAVSATATGADEKIVACGRGAIGELAVDGDSVVWTEPGKGIFVAPR